MSNVNPYEAPITPPKSGNANAGELADRGSRFVGALVDGVVQLVILFPLGFVLGIGLVGLGIELESVVGSLLVTAFSLVLGIGAFLAINGYLLSTRGQTVGKMVAKTRIVGESNRQILPLSHVILKRYLPLWIATAIPYVGFIFALVDALLIFRPTVKCLHDDIAGTIVVKA